MKNKKSVSYYGFTLIELMVVVAIIAVLIGISVTKIGGLLQKIKIEQAKGQMKALAIALKEYYIDVGEFPVNKPGAGGMGTYLGTNYSYGLTSGAGNTMRGWEEVLIRGRFPNTATFEPIPNWAGPYITKVPSSDPWKHRYLFWNGRLDTQTLTAIVCMGPHGTPDGLNFGEQYLCPLCGQTHPRGPAIANIWANEVKTDPRWLPDKEGFSIIPRDGDINNLPQNGGNDFSIVLWLESK